VRLFLAGVVVAVAVVVAGPAPPARACSCTPPSIGMVNDADAAFVGRLVKTQVPESPPATPDTPVLVGGGTVTHEFAVDRVVKGNLGSRVFVETSGDSASCGLTPSPDQPIGVAIYRSDDGAWRSGLCSRIPLDMAASIPSAPGDGGSIAYVPMLALSLAAIAVAAIGSRR
jgi:hypothetical protein